MSWTWFVDVLRGHPAVTVFQFSLHWSKYCTVNTNGASHVSLSAHTLHTFSLSLSVVSVVCVSLTSAPDCSASCSSAAPAPFDPAARLAPSSIAAAEPAAAQLAQSSIAAAEPTSARLALSNVAAAERDQGRLW